MAGVFSLVRFRSVPGSAKDICTLFLAMGAGLIAGMGYLSYALLFTIIMSAVLVLYNIISLKAPKKDFTFNGTGGAYRALTR